MEAQLRFTKLHLNKQHEFLNSDETKVECLAIMHSTRFIQGTVIAVLKQGTNLNIKYNEIHVCLLYIVMYLY